MKKYYDVERFVREKILSNPSLANRVNHNVFLASSMRGTQFAVPCITINCMTPTRFYKKVSRFYRFSVVFNIFHQDPEEVVNIQTELVSMFDDVTFVRDGCHVYSQLDGFTNVSYSEPDVCYTSVVSMEFIVSEEL